MPTVTRKPKRKTAAQLRAEFVGTKKLWKLLKMALADLLVCERATKKYRIDMGQWIGFHDGKCEVCLAGACLVQHNAVKLWERRFEDAGIDAKNRASALDHLALGLVEYAADDMRVEIPNGFPGFVDIVRYADDRKRWWEQMRKLLADLRKANI